MVKTLLLSSFLLFCTLLQGQDLHYVQYTTDDGLAHNVGYQIIQDSKGFIWIGTDNGLSRFDGKNFKNYGIEDGLNSPYIINITEGDDGTIWVSPYREKLNFLKGGKIHNVDFFKDLGRLVSISHQDMKFVVFGRGYHSCSIFQPLNNDQIFKSLVFSLNGDHISGIFKPVAILSLANPPPKVGLKIYNFIKNNRYELLLSTDKGLFVLNHQEGTVKPFIIDNVKVNKDSFFGLAKGIEDHVWVYDGERLINLMTHHRSSEIPPSFRPPDGDGEGPLISYNPVTHKIIYINNNRTKLVQYDPSTREFEDLNAKLKINTSISCFVIDKDGNIWITTMGQGVFCVYNSVVFSFSFTNNLGHHFKVNDIAQDKNGKIWMGGVNALYFQDTLSQQWQRVPLSNIFEKRPYEIHGLYLPSNQNLIAHLSMRGRPFLFSFNPVNDVPFLWKSGAINYFILMGNERYGSWSESYYDLLATDNTMQYLLKAFKFRVTGKLQIAQISIEKEDFIAYDKTMPYGLYYNIKRKWVSIREGGGLPSDRIRDLIATSEDTLWLATPNGVASLTRESDGTLTPKTILQHPANCLLFDSSGYLWIGAPDKLIRMHVAENIIQAFTKEDGLISENIECLFLGNQNRLWIGTDQGLSMLNLNDPLPQHKAPLIYIEDVFIHNKKKDTDSVRTLPENTPLQINYVAVDLPKAKEIVYAYKLRQDADWQTTTNPSITFNDLKTGDYHFQVKAKNQSDIWSESVSFQFSVLPPWWKTGWAYLLYGILGAAIIWLFIRRRTAQLTKKAMAERKMVQLELNALQAQMNPHFIFNALNAIQHYILSNEEDLANEYLSRFARLMRLFLEASKSTYTNLADEKELLELYLNLEKLRFEEKFEYSVNTSAVRSHSEVLLPSMLVQPFVENAVNHGILHLEKDGKVNVQFKEEEALLICTVEDNGVGRAKAKELRKNRNKSHKSRGMQLVKERLEALKHLGNEKAIKIQTLDLTDQNGEPRGTKVIIQIPLR